MKKVLVLAPHTDDGELGCGGTIARLIEEGREIYYVAFSSAEKSVPVGLPKDILKEEVAQATSILGIQEKNLLIYDFEVRDFPRVRQQILEEMVRLGREIAPDLVLMPSINDTHQDHNTISAEGFRAFKKTTILGYEMPWNNLTFLTNTFIALEERHLLKKIDALSCYKSQTGRFYSTVDFVKSLAVVRGTQIGVKYAEVFDTVRWVMR